LAEHHWLEANATSFRCEQGSADRAFVGYG
jgi:hypothetical protein